MDIKLISAIGFLLVSTGSAWANKQSYCAAYATDFANAQAKDKQYWQHKYDIAAQSCLTAPSPTRDEILPKHTLRRSVEIIPPEPILVKAKMEPGSDNWNAYCSKKYTSFNITTGMYHSHTGVDRKCLVTKP